jgi:hypothetical protein
MSLTTVSVSLGRVMSITDLSRYVSDYCVSITKKSDVYHWFITLCLTTVSVSLRRVMSITDLSCYVSDYCVNITKKSDKSITVNYHAMSLITVWISLLRRLFTVIWGRFDFGLIWLGPIWPATNWLRRGIRTFVYQSCLTTVSVSLGRVICLSQWSGADLACYH